MTYLERQAWNKSQALLAAKAAKELWDKRNKGKSGRPPELIKEK